MAGKIRFLTAALILLFAVTILPIPASAAANPEFTLDMDSLNLQMGVSSKFVVSLANAQGARIVSLEGLEDFDILSENQTSTTSIVNSTVSYKVDIHYTVMPKKTGTFVLKANVEYNGQIYETNSLEVTVREASDDSNKNQNLFAKTTVSNEEAYLGEKIVLTYEVYSRYAIDSLGLTDYTSIDGAVAKDLSDGQITAESVYIDGDKYTKYVVKQLIIDPVKDGTLVIPSYNLQVNVIVEDSFGGFGGFMQSTSAVYLQTEAKNVTVKPLPSDGRPADFSGVVGELTMSGNYSRNELNYGESLTLQINIQGSCNIDGLKNIVSDIPGFTTYETQKDLSEYVNDNKYYAEKTFETIMIPEKNGEIKVSPIYLSYFNPSTAKYETAEIPDAMINILGDMPEIGGAFQNSNYESVVINQIDYSNSNLSNDYLVINLPKGALYTFLFFTAAFLALAFLLVFAVKSRKKQSTPLKALYKQLRTEKDANGVYNCFNAMIKQRCNMNLKASSRESVKLAFNDAKLAGQIIEIMDFAESPEFYNAEAAGRLKKMVKAIFVD